MLIAKLKENSIIILSFQHFKSSIDKVFKLVTDKIAYSIPQYFTLNITIESHSVISLVIYITHLLIFYTFPYFPG